jgi:uncharacterized protein (TIGR01777 family)
MARRIIIAGGTGFIGKALISELIRLKYEVVVLTRNIEKAKSIFGNSVIIEKWDGATSNGWGHLADGSFAIINLAGESVSKWPWNEKLKEKIISSRINSVRSINQAVIDSKIKPEVLILGTAIGYYGAISEKIYYNEEASNGTGFLPEVVKLWEDELDRIGEIKIRKIILRTGVVLGLQDGMLSKLYKSFSFFSGGHFGNGHQGVSWIHVKDEINAIIFLMEETSTSGVFNLCSPNPVSAEDFSKTLGAVMNRPSWLHLPSFFIKLVFGQMGEEVLINGLYVIPDRLVKSGFTFQFPFLENALKDIIKGNKN